MDFFASSFQDASFWTSYIEEGWQDHDPSVQNALSAIPSTLWKISSPTRFRKTNKKDDLNGAVAQGRARSVLCFSNLSANEQSVAGFTVTFEDEASDLDREKVSSFQKLSKIFFAHRFSYLELPELHLLRGITERERDVLGLLAAGRVLGQISYELGISYRMVSKHFASARNKLGAKTNENLIMIAKEIGLV